MPDLDADIGQCGPSDRPERRLSQAQLRELQTVLEAGPAAWGWDEDQCCCDTRSLAVSELGEEVWLVPGT